MKDFTFDLQRFATHEISTSDDWNKYLFTEAAEGDTLKVTQDIILSSSPNAVTKSIIIDLNGHSVTTTSTSVMPLTIGTNGNVTIEDSVGTGSISSEADAQAQWGLITNGNGTLTINGGTIRSKSTCVIINGTNGNSSTLTINGGSIISESELETIVNSGDLYITNGNITSKKYAIFMANSDGNVTISGGSISGDSAAIYKHQEARGTVTITGGTFSSDVSEYVDSDNYKVTSNGSTYTVSVDDTKIPTETTFDDLTYN
ncbi:MAG: hypothetical protein IJ797_09965, partial [Selenomonadaceae bacterium]|nr:hypothetical protein [Selenomonadaceae bacterium]